MKKKNRKLVKLLAYGYIGMLLLLVLVLIGEFLFRLSPRYGRSGFEFDKHLIWRQNRGLKAQKPYAMGEGGQSSFTLRFNKQGFRGNNFRLDKKAGIKRILVLGDSYTAGLDFPDEKIFTQQLEAKLNAQGKERYEVMNVSAPAWATDQHYLYWTTEGKNYHPDYLILIVSPNDIREAYNKKLIQLKEDGNLMIHQAYFSRTERLGWYLSNNSSLFQWFQTKVLEKNYGDFFKIFNSYPINYGIRDSTDWDAPLYLTKPFEEVKKSYDLFDTLVHQLEGDCRKEKVKLLIAKVPIKIEYDGTYARDGFDPQKVSAMMDSLMVARNITFLNMNKKLEETSTPLFIFFSREYHFNKKGHDFCANNLYEFVKANE